MAGDWIKIEKATPGKPECLQISEILGIHPTHSFGLCVKFWIWCDDQLHDGNARGVTSVTLDFIIGHMGFTNALVKVGWLRDRSGSLEVPHFDRHLSESAKNRALTKERVKNLRAKSNDPTVSNVTQKPLPEKRREEKRKEEENKEALSRKSTSVPPPDTPWPQSASERGGGMDQIMKRINSLRPEWQLPAQWNASEMHALHGGAASQICELTDADWQDLTAFMAVRGLPKDFWQPRSRLKFVETFSDVCASLQRWRDKGNGGAKPTNQANPYA